MARPTLKDLAARTGLSRSTVATILRGQDAAFSPATAAKVREAAAALGWKPNQFSRNLQRGRFGNLLYVFSSVGRNVSSSLRILVGLGEEAERRGQHLVVLPVEGGGPKTGSDFMTTRFFDALIVNVNQFEPEAVKTFETWLERFEVPVVWLNHARARNAVYPDEEAGADLMARRLLDSKAKRVLYVGPRKSSHFSATLRPKRLASALTGAGVDFARLGVETPPGGPYFGEEDLAELSVLPLDRFDHVVFYGPYLIARFLAQVGPGMPQRPRILSFDCTETQDPLGMWGGVAWPWEELARRAVAAALGDGIPGKMSFPSLTVAPAWLGA